MIIKLSSYLANSYKFTSPLVLCDLTLEGYHNSLVVVASRKAFKDLKFGNIDVPKGLSIWVMVVTLHTNLDIEGDDAYKFNPERFSNGTIGACKLPHMYMPFGVGPRVCLGQNLAMVELKMLIALILSKFIFSLSMRYVQSPTLRLLMEPEHGVHLLVKKL
ncbi:Cytokinin hydroxylase [Glycine soja]|nr:Cytokinin hydroxylase [Glycine soja]